MYSSQRERENEIIVSNVSLYLVSRKFCQTKIIVNGNTEWFPLFGLIGFAYLKETVKDRYNYGKGLRSLYVTMDICYKYKIRNEIL